MFYVAAGLYAAFAGAWLLVGLAAAVAEYVPGVHSWAVAAGAGRHGSPWDGVGTGLLAGADHTYPLTDVVLDYTFSAVSLAIAAVLFRLARRDWTVRLLVVGMVGSAGAFNLQAHAAIDAVAAATGVQIGWWHSALLHGVGGVAYVFALLLFPTGRLDRRGQRGWPARVLILAAVAGAVGLLSVSTAEYPHTISFVLFFGLLTPVAGVAAQLGRAARAPTAEARQQSRLLVWALSLSFGAAVVLTIIALATQMLHTTGLPNGTPGVTSDMPGMTNDLPGLESLGSQTAIFWIFRAVFTLIPCAVMAGVLRFRLWEVERLFNRALTYGVLVVVIGVVYIGVVVRLDRLFGLSTDMVSPPQLVASGLLALALQPARARVERWADRLVYGRRTAPYEVLAGVSALSQATEPGAETLGSLARVIGEGLSVVAASVIVALPDGAELTYTWPPRADPRLTEHRFPVAYRGEAVGALAIPRSAGGLAPDRLELLDDLAASVGVILHNARLSIQLEHRLRVIERQSAEIRASRWRLAAAQDSERRDLERDLHDGAQPRLTAVRLTLGLLTHLASTDNRQAAGEALDRLREQIASALDSLREMSRGLDPKVLSGHGLAPALREEAAALGPRVAFRIAPGVEMARFDPVVEAAAYFCCVEALQNAVKHCPDASVTVTLELEGGRLRFSVADDGQGFDRDRITVGSGGSGLQNMVDRAEAANGTLEIATAPGQGTEIRGWVPASPATLAVA